MALSKLKLQQLREVCQEKDIDYSGLRRNKDLIERINEVREARQAAVDDDESEDEVEFGEDLASVAIQPVSQNGGSNCSEEESTDIVRMRLQLELARAEERKVQAEKERLQAEEEMMRKKVELGFQSEEMTDAGAFAAKSLLEIKFQKMVEQTNDVLSFLMFLKRLVLCVVFEVNSWPECCQV